MGGGGEKGGCPGSLGCLAASLGSIHYIRVALLILTAKNVSRYFQVSPGRQNHAQLRTAGLDQLLTRISVTLSTEITLSTLWWVICFLDLISFFCTY